MQPLDVIRGHVGSAGEQMPGLGVVGLNQTEDCRHGAQHQFARAGLAELEAGGAAGLVLQQFGLDLGSDLAGQFVLPETWRVQSAFEASRPDHLAAAARIEQAEVEPQFDRHAALATHLQATVQYVVRPTGATRIDVTAVPFLRIQRRRRDDVHPMKGRKIRSH